MCQQADITLGGKFIRGNKSPQKRKKKKEKERKKEKEKKLSEVKHAVSHRL